MIPKIKHYVHHSEKYVVKLVCTEWPENGGKHRGSPAQYTNLTKKEMYIYLQCIDLIHYSEC